MNHMVKDVMFGKTMRKSYAKYEEILEIPNMLKIQKDSYQWFLETGLREVFKDVGTISDFSGKLELSFLDYSMDEKPKYTIEECKERDATYAKPIKVRVRLRNTETDEIKEQEIFMGDFPIMTNGGTFVINGAAVGHDGEITHEDFLFLDLVGFGVAQAHPNLDGLGNLRTGSTPSRKYLMTLSRTHLISLIQ